MTDELNALAASSTWTGLAAAVAGGLTIWQVIAPSLGYDASAVGDPQATAAELVTHLDAALTGLAALGLWAIRTVQRATGRKRLTLLGWVISEPGQPGGAA